MVDFDGWCDAVQEVVNGHNLKVLSGVDGQLTQVRDLIAAVVPTHYASEGHVARILERLGKTEAAQFIREKLPQSKRIRSGDLTEILATEYIADKMPYSVPIKRLRWKDHRNMSMRGDDVVGINRNPESGRLQFLKSESKSRVTLGATVITEARQGLDKDAGLPSPHALSFISERLLEQGNQQLADAIDDAQLKQGITVADVEHLLFTFSGNDPKALLHASLQRYGGAIRQHGVGLRIIHHAKFIHDVYEKVIADGDDG